MNEPFGTFTLYTELNPQEQEVVGIALKGADNSKKFNLCFNSDFPVGSGILAADANGNTKTFMGANVENKWIHGSICAERNAATTAVAAGYTEFRIVSVACPKSPKGSPCGACRQFLLQFGATSTLLNIADANSNVRKTEVKNLLPAATGQAVTCETMDDDSRRLIERLLILQNFAHVPYSGVKGAAIFTATNNSGETKSFEGVSDENAAYPASAVAESVAMRNARTCGYIANGRLLTLVKDPLAHNPIEGDALQILREFGLDSRVTIVGIDSGVVESSLNELLPDSFGPDCL